MIAKRRIGHSPFQIKDFILNTDLDGLLPEHCELLLKFIPTNEEVSNYKEMPSVDTFVGWKSTESVWNHGTVVLTGSWLIWLRIPTALMNLEKQSISCSRWATICIKLSGLAVCWKWGRKWDRKCDRKWGRKWGRKWSRKWGRNNYCNLILFSLAV